MNTRCELWAKQDGFDQTYPLIAHLLDTATIAGALYDEWLRTGLRELFEENLGDKARDIVRCVAGLHDVGKAIPLFQQRPKDTAERWQKIRETIDESKSYRKLPKDSIALDSSVAEARRHERISAYSLDPTIPVAISRSETSWLHLALGGHHGRFHSVARSRDVKDLLDDLDDAGWLAAQQDLSDLVLTACHLNRSDLPHNVDPTITMLLSGLIVLADRIASGSHFVDGGFAHWQENPEIFNTPTEWIKLREREAQERIRATVGVYSPWESAEQAQHSIMGDFQPRPIQQEALHAGDGLWSLMATTGSGKTEAALLRHSTRPERLIFLLPTQATTNAIMRRVQHAYRDTSNVAALAHGLASVEDFYQQPLSIYDDEATGQYSHSAGSCTDQPTGLYPSSFVRAGAARLFAPVCVGTIDQALAAALPGKWIHFRLLSLANAHIVIDEVHTLDTYQSKLLEELLPWLAKTRTRVTFLTATMPSAQRQQLISAYTQADVELEKPIFPSIDVVTSKGRHAVPVAVPSITMNINLREATYPTLVDAHVQWHHELRQKYPAARLGIICNTVDRAQETARRIRESGEQVLVLHSRMTAEHRRRHAELLLKLIGPGGTGEAITVVGTQAIEASLDIDLDFLNSELCPAPSLIQRAGRQWRREDPHRGQRCGEKENKTLTVTWFDSEESWQYRPYFQAELLRTREWLASHSQLTIPDHAQEFIDAAHVDFANAISDADLSMLAEEAVKAIRGESSRAKITPALQPSGGFRDFTVLTDPAPADESQTRLIDENANIRVIFGNGSAAIPGGWEGTFHDLISLQATDRTAIRTALQASMPLPIPRGEKARKEFLAQHNIRQLTGARTLLEQYYFFPDAGQFYDADLGFSRKLAEE